MDPRQMDPRQMDPRQLDRWIETRMARVMDGSDEDLDILLRELRPLALELVPKGAHERVHITHTTTEAVSALYEALMLWSPAWGPFLTLLQRRVVQRVNALFQRLDALERAAMAVRS